MCSAQEYQRKLHPDDLPLRAQQQRIQRGEQCHFIVRKNPHYPRRRLASVSDSNSSAIIAAPLTESNLAALDEQMAEQRLNKSTSCTHSAANAVDANANSRRYVSVYLSDRNAVCKMCRNTFRSCDFCAKTCRKSNGSRLTRIPTATNLAETRTEDNEAIGRVTATYNPVYNIREIRTVSNSFSSPSCDKKESDSIGVVALTPVAKRPSVGSVTSNGTTTPNVVVEAVKNNPAKGYGNFVYI